MNDLHALSYPEIFLRLAAERIELLFVPPVDRYTIHVRLINSERNQKAEFIIPKIKILEAKDVDIVKLNISKAYVDLTTKNQ